MKTIFENLKKDRLTKKEKERCENVELECTILVYIEILKKIE